MNNKKKILIVSPFFYPEPISTGKFNTDFVRSLSEKGHEVTVLCFHPFYPSWKSKKSNEQIEGVTIIRGGNSLIYPKKNNFKKASFRSWVCIFCFKKASKSPKK